MDKWEFSMTGPYTLLVMSLNGILEKESVPVEDINGKFKGDGVKIVGILGKYAKI